MALLVSPGYLLYSSALPLLGLPSLTWLLKSLLSSSTTHLCFPARFFWSLALVMPSIGQFQRRVHRGFHSSVVHSWWLSPHSVGRLKLCPLSSYPNKTTSFCLGSTLNPLDLEHALWKSRVNVELARFLSPRDCTSPPPLVVLMLSGDIKWVFNVIYPVFK